ncbi:MAG: AsmA-like C-terminal region-containing protein [Ferrovibrio sp.]
MTRLARRTGLALVLLLLLAAAAIVLVVVRPRPVVQALASHLLGREVAVSQLSISFGDPVRVKLRQLQVANMPGGSAADMIAIEAVDAALDRAALLRGRLVYEKLEVTRPRIALERDTSGRGNWEFGSGDDSVSPPSGSRLVLIPKNRQQFPDLLDFRLTGGEVRFRTSSGKWLRLPLDDLAIHAADDKSPVSIVLDGGYNDTDAQLTATTASFNAFRDASKPFDAAITIALPGVRLDFKGVLGLPLDFDTVQGRLALEARRLDDLIGIFDTPTGIAAPLKMAGGFSRSGDAWQLDNIAGDIGDNAFAGRIALDEGGRGEADDLQFHLDFDKLDLPSVLPQTAKGKDGDDWRRLTLRPDTAADAAHLDIQVSADTLLYGSHVLRQAAAAVEVSPGRIRLHGMSASLGQPDEAGHLRLAGELRAAGDSSSALTATLQLEKAEAGAVLQALGLPDGPARLAGLMEGRATLAMTGATLGDAVKTARGHAVLAMQQGRIARSLVEAAAADLRTLFRDRGDGTALRCLLAMAEMKDGSIALAPLLLRSDGGTIRAAGRIDLPRQEIDLVLRSDPMTTGFFALDIPIHLQGPLRDPAAKPERQAVLPDLPPADLPPAQAVLARANPCGQ